MAEIYNSPSSPYWALKAALPLALSSDHPFWQADGQPLPDLPTTSVQSVPNTIICRDESMQHHYSLVAGQCNIVEGFSTDQEKYNKLAYSTAFGVSVASRQPGLLGAGHDSMLVLCRDGRHFRMREDIADQSVTDDAVYSRWKPFDDVCVDTWLVPVLPWHVRVHRVETTHELHSAEGGFALDRSGANVSSTYEHLTDDATAIARYPAGISVLEDLSGMRNSSMALQDSNVNLAYQRTIVPTLTGKLRPGETWLTTGVLATPDPQTDIPLQARPEVSIDGSAFTVTDATGDQIHQDRL